jgi:hypothetical protein
MSRHRNRITTMNRRVERSRQWREEKRHLRKTRVRIVYDRERGNRKYPAKSTLKTIDLCPILRYVGSSRGAKA